MNHFTYKNWHVSYNQKPIGTRLLDWDASHEDYDGAPDADCDDLSFCAPSAEACRKYIDEMAEVCINCDTECDPHAMLSHWVDDDLVYVCNDCAEENCAITAEKEEVSAYRRAAL